VVVGMARKRGCEVVKERFGLKILMRSHGLSTIASYILSPWFLPFISREMWECDQIF
jgi:hypothetical protein